jgi:teichuronic acid biosynthesis glycosyltransferase TuaG
MNAPLVSVVMPCYKSANTLQMSVEGVLKQQTVALELLLLVDGDADGTYELARHLAANDPRVRLIYSRLNRGVVRMRNLGIRLAKAPWVAFCDADDWWLPQKLPQQLNLAQQQGANVLCSAFFYQYEGRSKAAKLVQLPAYISLKSLLRTNSIAMSTALFHRESLGRHYFVSMPQPLIHEDYAFWLELFKKDQVVAAYLPDPTTFIRVQPGSRSANKWLALRSHAYVLKYHGHLPPWRIGLHLLSYAFHALHKRLWHNHP